jgi:hemolysin D
MLRRIKSFFSRDNLEYEFLPPALEIESTPPSPLGRFTIWFIVVLTVTAVAWSYFGKVDQVAVAAGRVIPDGKVKVIQPMEEGVVKNILVTEGQRVKEGQVLIELDPTLKQADADSSAKLLSIYQSDKERLIAELSGGAIKDSVFTEPGSSNNPPRDFFFLQKKFKDAKESEYKAKEDALKLSIAQKENELSKAEANLAYLGEIVPIIRDEEKSIKHLHECDAISKMDLYSKQKELYEVEKELETQKIIVQQIANGIEEEKRNLDALNKEKEKEILNELLERERSIASLEGEAVKAKKRYELGTIVSPVDGYVHELATHTIGGIVTSAQALVTVVPDGTPLVVEANALNKDIGFLEEGQKAEIKFDTFPFQKYGTIKGKVLSISPDAVEDEKLGPVYKIKVDLESTSLNIDGENVDISSGMTVSAEIKTGKRKIIEFFLSPIIKYARESLTIR